MKIKFVALGAFLMAVVLLLSAAAPPAPIQRNQFSTNIVGALIKGNVGFDSAVNITGTENIGGNSTFTNIVTVQSNLNVLGFGIFQGSVVVTNNTPSNSVARFAAIGGSTTNVTEWWSNGVLYAYVKSNMSFALPDGSASYPSMMWKSDDDGSGTGLYRSAADRIAFAVNGNGPILQVLASTVEAGAALVATADATYSFGITNSQRFTIAYLSRGLVIGPNAGGGLLTNILTARAVLDFPSTGPVKASDLTITVTGVTTNDTVMLGVPPICAITNTSYFAFPSNDTVWVRFCNHDTNTSQNPGPGSFSVLVNRF